MQAKGVTPVLSWTALRRVRRAAGNFFPVGCVLVAEDAKHGVQVPMYTFHRIRLQVVGGCEGESDACSLESLLHHLGLEVYNVCKAHNTCSLVVLRRGMASEPFAENILKRQ